MTPLTHTTKSEYTHMLTPCPWIVVHDCLVFNAAQTAKHNGTKPLGLNAEEIMASHWYAFDGKAIYQWQLTDINLAKKTMPNFISEEVE